MMSYQTSPGACDACRVGRIAGKDIVAYMKHPLPPKTRFPEQLLNFMRGKAVPKGFHRLKSLSENPCVKNSCESILVQAVAAIIRHRHKVTRMLTIIYNLRMNKENRKKIFYTGGESKCRFEFKLAWGSAPHPDKVWKGGEDALFVSKNVIVVADGVGGWIKHGIDSGEYARKLIAIIKELLEKDKELYFIERPEELAIRAVQRNEEKGSATLSIMTLHPVTGMVRSYHIGDSIFGLFKHNGETFLAQEQQRMFNVPLQVFGGSNNIIRNESDSDDEQPVSDVFKGSYNQFSLSQVTDGYILMASDGLWDNLHLNDIRAEISTTGDLVSRTRSLIRKTKQVWNLKDYESPFYCKALRQNENVPRGGKVDDISIILAEVLCLPV